MEKAAPQKATAHRPQQVNAGGYSSTGPQRRRNEDAFGLPPAGGVQARYGTLVALADGVGGRPGGALASRAAVHFLHAVYYAPVGPSEPDERLRRCFQIVNTLIRTVVGSANGREPEALTTLVGAVAFDQRLWVANVGDSRAYLVRGRSGQIQRLTEDHSQLVLAPAPTAAGSPEATQQLAQTRALTRAIGLEEQCQVDVYTYSWAAGDRLILCSDGVRSLTEAELAAAVLARPPALAARRLVEQALERDGSDNATVMVMAWDPRAAARPRRASPACGSLGLLTIAAITVGLLIGWLSAAALWLYLGGAALLR